MEKIFFRGIWGVVKNWDRTWLILKLQSSSIQSSVPFPTCCTPSLHRPPQCTQWGGVSRLISRKNMVGGPGDSGDKQEALALLGPFLAGRCCHRRCHDPTQHTSGEKKNRHLDEREDRWNKSSFGHVVNGWLERFYQPLKRNLSCCHLCP